MKNDIVMAGSPDTSKDQSYAKWTHLMVIYYHPSRSEHEDINIVLSYTDYLDQETEDVSKIKIESQHAIFNACCSLGSLVGKN